VQAHNKYEPLPHEEQIKNLLRTSHLNKEKKKALINICHELNDQLTFTTKIEHIEIITKTDSSRVNVRPLSEKHKIEIVKRC